MEPIFIISIVVGGVVFILLLFYLANLIKRCKAARELKEELDETYTDPNIAKMEYDIAYYDEDIQSRINAMNIKTDKQVTIEEVIHGEEQAVPPEEDALFAKIDDEGMEEISGNYRPEDKKD
ncbi:MAG: hypothetical protein LUD19_02715 [Clostridia bacterium]|nr:hypothetical protein [Clostridia bacterium]